jgi:hypothetical protein
MVGESERISPKFLIVSPLPAPKTYNKSQTRRLPPQDPSLLSKTSPSLTLLSDSTSMATNADSAKPSGGAFFAETGIEDVFGRMAKMEMEKHEKMMQLEGEKLQLALRNISLERTVYSLRMENKERETSKTIPAVDIVSDEHTSSEKKPEKPKVVDENVCPSFAGLTG